MLHHARLTMYACIRAYYYIHGAISCASCIVDALYIAVWYLVACPRSLPGSRPRAPGMERCVTPTHPPPGIVGRKYIFRIIRRKSVVRGYTDKKELDKGEKAYDYTTYVCLGMHTVALLNRSRTGLTAGWFFPGPASPGCGFESRRCQTGSARDFSEGG